MTDKMKIYIAGPISGIQGYKLNFEIVQYKLEKLGYAVMNPAILPKDFGYENYMEICFAMIRVCDYIIMLKGWRESPGAVREYNYASSLGKMVLFEEEI